jgi:hypothetical protein
VIYCFLAPGVLDAVHWSAFLPSSRLLYVIVIKRAAYCRREKAAITSFFGAAGPPTLIICYQVAEEQNTAGEWVKRGTNPSLQVLTSPSHRLTGNACYFVRVNSKGITEKTILDDIIHGVIKGGALLTLRTLVNDFFGPLLRKQEKWGRLSNNLLAELLKRVGQFGSTLIEAAESLAGGVELTKPDLKLLSIPMNLTGFKDAADKPEVAKEFTRCLKAWIAKV